MDLELSGFELWRRTGFLAPIAGGDDGDDPPEELDSPVDEPSDSGDAQGQDSGVVPEGQAPEGDEYEGLPAVPDGDMVPRSVLEETRREAARRRTNLRGYEATGVTPAEVSDLVEFRDRLRTDEGVRETFAALGQVLGIGKRELQNFVEQALGQAPRASRERDEFLDDEPDDDVPLTRAQYLALEEERRQREREEQQQRDHARAMHEATWSVFSELKIDGDENQRVRNDVAARADAILAASPTLPVTPQRAQRALKAAWQSMVDDYPSLAREVATANGNGNNGETPVERKARQAARTPAPLRSGGGGPPGDTPPEEPVDLADAKRRARERMRQAGIPV